jgi:hypothetical protein
MTAIFRGLFSDASMPSRVKHRDNRGAPGRPLQLLLAVPGN